MILSRATELFDEKTLYAWKLFIVQKKGVNLNLLREFLADSEEVHIDESQPSTSGANQTSANSYSAAARAPPKELTQEEKANWYDAQYRFPALPKSVQNFKIPMKQVQNIPMIRPPTAQGAESNVGRDGQMIDKYFHCLMCPNLDTSHRLYQCGPFIGLSLLEREDYVNRKNICALCLRGYHDKWNCNEERCRQCNDYPHNSQLCSRSKSKRARALKGAQR